MRPLGRVIGLGNDHVIQRLHCTFPGQSTTRVDCNPCSNQHCIVPDVCSHVIVQQQEVDRYATFEIMSPNHPNTYPANTDCVWVISAPWATVRTGHRLNIKTIFLQVQGLHYKDKTVWGGLIFITGIPTLISRCIYIETGPWFYSSNYGVEIYCNM